MEWGDGLNFLSRLRGQMKLMQDPLRSLTVCESPQSTSSSILLVIIRRNVGITFLVENENTVLGLTLI